METMQELARRYVVATARAANANANKRPVKEIDAAEDEAYEAQQRILEMPARDAAELEIRLTVFADAWLDEQDEKLDTIAMNADLFRQQWGSLFADLVRLMKAHPKTRL